MDNQINIKPADALKRIITNLAAMHRRKRAANKNVNQKSIKAFWYEIGELTGWGSNYSAHLVTSHGFNADTGEPL